MRVAVSAHHFLGEVVQPMLWMCTACQLINHGLEFSLGEILLQASTIIDLCQMHAATLMGCGVTGCFFGFLVWPTFTCIFVCPPWNSIMMPSMPNRLWPRH